MRGLYGRNRACSVRNLPKEMCFSREGRFWKNASSFPSWFVTRTLFSPTQKTFLPSSLKYHRCRLCRFLCRHSSFIVKAKRTPMMRKIALRLVRRMQFYKVLHEPNFHPGTLLLKLKDKRSQYVQIELTHNTRSSDAICSWEQLFDREEWWVINVILRWIVRGNCCVYRMPRCTIGVRWFFVVGTFCGAYRRVCHCVAASLNSLYISKSSDIATAADCGVFMGRFNVGELITTSF